MITLHTQAGPVVLHTDVALRVVHIAVPAWDRRHVQPLDTYELGIDPGHRPVGPCGDAWARAVTFCEQYVLTLQL